MHGPACIFWAGLISFLLKAFVVSGHDEIFCSEADRAAARASVNDRLQHLDFGAWQDFVGHAAKTNEAFVLAAMLLAGRQQASHGP